MGKEGPLLACMEVEVVGAVWMVDVVPGRLVTVKAGFSASCGRRGGDGSAPRSPQPQRRIPGVPVTSPGGSPLPWGAHTSPGVPPACRPLSGTAGGTAGKG